MKPTHRTPSENEENRPEGTARLVDVGEYSGSVASLGESGEDTRSSIDARETDGEDRDADGNVDEVVESGNSSLVNHDDEGRSSGSSIVSAQKALIVVGKVETDDEKGAGAPRRGRGQRRASGREVIGGLTRGR